MWIAEVRHPVEGVVLVAVLDPDRTPGDLARYRYRPRQPDVVGRQFRLELRVAGDLVVMIARQQRDGDPLPRRPERAEDGRKLPDQLPQLLQPLDIRKLPEAEGIADDDQFCVFVPARNILQKGGQFPRECARAQRLVPADMQVADKVIDV